jgi:hypothetical protein
MESDSASAALVVNRCDVAAGHVIIVMRWILVSGGPIRIATFLNKSSLRGLLSLGLLGARSVVVLLNGSIVVPIAVLDLLGSVRICALLNGFLPAARPWTFRARFEFE